MKKKIKHEINGVHVCSVRLFVSDGGDRERLDEYERVIEINDIEKRLKRGRGDYQR